MKIFGRMLKSYDLKLKLKLRKIFQNIIMLMKKIINSRENVSAK